MVQKNRNILLFKSDFQTSDTFLKNVNLIVIDITFGNQFLINK